MEFRPIVPEDKEEYEKYYRSQYRIASDASFATTYAWAKCFSTTVCVADDVLCLKGKSDSPVPYFMMPIGFGDKEKFLHNLYAYCKDLSIHFSLHWLLREDISIVKKVFGEKIKIEPNRNGAEYVYETSALRSLSGKKLHAKRNHVNAFKSAYSFSFTEINADNITEAERFVLLHCKTDDEKIAMKRLFDLYFFLRLQGMILYVDGKIVAVTAGEKITHDTALIHLEKADVAYSGAYPAVNQLFIENFFSDTIYVNREEDMGIEGLRKAKLSYHPAFLLEKFTVTEVI